MQDVKFIISVVRGFVVRGRVHAPDDLHVFCPNFYWQVLKNTFGDTKVYSSSLLSPAQAQAFLQSKSSQQWLKPYRRGINKNATIPISYVLLKKKKKKQFAVARPIVSYSNFIFGRLFRAASTVLNTLLPAVYPGSCGLQTLPEIFQELHAFLCNAPIDIHLQQHNQDLVGFFTSLPIEQLMGSVNHLVTQYAANQNADLSEISFTVQLAAAEPKLRVFQGQFKRHKIRTGVIWLKDLWQLCELSLHTSLFSHVKRVCKQQRGSATGNQISPSLANIAVSYLEHQWYQKHKDALKNHAEELYIVRYVDNRLVLCGQHLAERRFMQEFLADLFYRHPVELEDVTNGEFPGTILDANL